MSMQLSCPFCNTLYLRLCSSQTKAGDTFCFFYVCDGCGAIGPAARTKGWALRKWNIRHADLRCPPAEKPQELLRDPTIANVYSINYG